MKILLVAFKKCLLILLFLFFGEQLYAQCSISYQGATCVGSPIIFSCNSVGSSNFNWNFNNEGTNTLRCDPIFTFATPGTKSVTLSLTQANGTTCNAQLTLKIEESPVIKSSALSQITQCFANNSYCFKDSSTVNGSSICSRIYLFDDGSTYTFSGDSTISFCHTFNDPEGGNFGLTIKLTSCNGCTSLKRYDLIAKVRPSPKLQFNSGAPKACDSLTLYVTNNTVYPLDSFQSFEWDWGDGTKTQGNKANPLNWGMWVSHKYKSQGPNNGFFDVKLSATDNNGCSSSFTFKNAAAVINTNVSIVSSKDSVCISDSEITFKIKEGAVPMTANALFIYEMPPVPANITRAWEGSHKFSKPGPHIIHFSFTSVLPGCGRTIYDTILVVGPKARITNGYAPNMDLNGYFQCMATDSVKFSNLSLYYHNDKNMIDDDSVLIQNKGFNAPLVHVFDLNNRTSVNPTHLDRNSEHVLTYWDFDDEYCEKCTSDIKNKVNINRNCRYSKDEFPTHKYTEWTDIYTRHYSSKPLVIPYYNADSGYVSNKLLWASDSFSIARDTIVYYAENAWGVQSKDSAIFNGLNKYPMRFSSVSGPSLEECNSTTVVYIKAGNTAYINPNNGNPAQLFNGPRYITATPGQSIVLSSNLDTLHFVYIMETRQDTVAKHLSGNMKVVKSYPNPNYSSGDSIQANIHRQRFFSGKQVRCMNVSLSLKDTSHPLACSSSDLFKLSIGQPNPVNLRKTGVQCIDEFNANYGITFLLDEIKPGCGSTWTLINPNVQLSPNNWLTAIGPNLSSGTIPTGPLPADVNKPFLAFPGSSLPGNMFSIRYDSADIKQVNGLIDVGLVVGNGFHSGGIYPEACQDTVYFENFARFPILEPGLNVVSGKFVNDVYSSCKMEPIVITPKPMHSSVMKDIGSISYSFTDKNSGKFHNENYSYQIEESYHRFQKVMNDSTVLMDYLKIVKSENHDTFKILSTQYIPIARITKWHAEADVNEVLETFKSRLEAYGYNISDFNETELAGLIWNGKGVIGKAYTGSRGLVDTTGIGDKIKIQLVADQKTVLHYRDTSILPIETHLNNINQSVSSYAFTPRQNGFYLIEMKLNSNLDNFCPRRVYKKAVVGFYMEMNYEDTIICPGQRVVCSPNFRYYNPYPDLAATGCPTNNPFLLDCIDYWRLRIQETGNPSREGYTRHDLNIDDDGTDSKSIFGGWPYSVTGLDNAPNNKLELGHHLGIYYNQDTGKTYVIRTAASDSMGCRDTFVQNIHVISARTKIKLSQEQPSCASIFTLQDSSYFQDPIALKTGKPAMKFVKRIVEWGDLSTPLILYNDLQSDVKHSYSRRGLYKIIQTFETDLGCSYTDSTVIYLPGPVPFYDTFVKLNYCKGDTVVYDNLTQYSPNDSCMWIWEFGDGKYASQIQTLNSSNNPIRHIYDLPGEFKPKLYVYYNIQLQNNKIRCVDQYPNPNMYDNIFRLRVINCDSTDLDNINKQSGIDMFPNPASQYVSFKSDTPVELEIYNSLGQIVGRLIVNDTSEFDLRHLVPGIYLVKTIDQQYVGKLLIE